MTQHRVTLWNSVPALMEMMVSYAGTIDRRIMPSLRLVFLSGDWIPVSLRIEFVLMFGRPKLSA